MRAVIQRVLRASVEVGGKKVAVIDRGLLVLIGIARGDREEDAAYLARKISELRMFEGQKGHIHFSVRDVGGEVLAISQFTLYGECRKGRRPSFTRAEAPERAHTLYRYFIRSLIQTGIPVQEGIFQEMMEVALVNEGPFTLLLESPPL